MELTQHGQSDFANGSPPTRRGGGASAIQATEGRSLIEWLRVLRDGWPAVIVCVILGLAVGAVVTLLQPTLYRSESTLATGSSRGFLDPEFASGLAPVTATVTRLAGSAAVLQGAGNAWVAAAPDAEARARRAKDLSLKWLGDHIQAQQVADSAIVNLSATAKTQTDASDLSTAAAHSLETAIANGPGSPSRAARGNTRGLVVRDFRARDKGKVSPSPTRNLLLGGNVGLVIGIVAGLALGATRRRVRRPDEMASELGIPVLGSIKVGQLGSGDDPGLTSARAHLQRLGQRDQGTVFLLTGTVRPERTAEVAEALTRTFAASARTVLVDADLSSRSISRRLQIDGGPGLGDLLDGGRGGGPQELFRPEQVTVTTVDGGGSGAEIEVLPAGEAPRDVPAALGSAGLAKSLQNLRLRYDYILVVGPGLDRPAEVIPLIAATDWSVLVTPRGERARTIESAHGLTDALAGRIAGALILNRR
jgi:polysaccharide biosynthesis transport protein